MSQQYVSLLTSIEIMSESPFCGFEQMAVMMGTYYAMDRMSKMKGEKKTIKKIFSNFRAKALNNHFLKVEEGG